MTEQDRVTMQDIAQRENDKLRARIAELEAENKALDDQLHQAYEHFNELDDEIDRWKGIANAKGLGP